MVTLSAVTCPRCREDRASLITEINDPMGRRYYCCVCGLEFKPPELMDGGGVGAVGLDDPQAVALIVVARINQRNCIICFRSQSHSK